MASPRLFLDVDDTLVKWLNPQRNDGLYLGDKYEINLELIAAASCLAESHDYQLVVWSGGGVQYAALWAERCFGTKASVLVLPKEMNLPHHPDICVDDVDIMPRDKRVRVVLDLEECPVCEELA